MASEIETALKSMATSVAKYVQDAAVMQVETRYVDLTSGKTTDFDDSKAAARTIIRLDGDSETVLPMRQNAAGVVDVDSGLFEVHQQNVNTAIEYRAKMLTALLGTLQGRRTTG